MFNCFIFPVPKSKKLTSGKHESKQYQGFPRMRNLRSCIQSSEDKGYIDISLGWYDVEI